jgi:ligand-binding SRPBCC domain-containing protein
MTVRVTRCERPDLFVDVMVRGAFARFTHVHRLMPEGASTRMIDEFDYRAPFCVLGRVADALFLERYMRRLIHRRACALERMAEARAGG